MKNKYLMIIAMALMLLPLASASLGTFKQNSCVEIKTILANTTAVNISTISYPNSSIADSKKVMTKTGQTFNYSFCDTTALGTYIYDYIDIDTGNVYVNDFEINLNGLEPPSSSTSVAVIILFSVIICVFLFGAWFFREYPIVMMAMIAIAMLMVISVLAIIMQIVSTESSTLNNVLIIITANYSVMIDIFWIFMIVLALYLFYKAYQFWQSQLQGKSFEKASHEED